MSGAFELDAFGNQALAEEAALNPILPEQIQPGFFAGVPKALAMAAPKAAGTLARLVELAGSVPTAVVGGLLDPRVDATQKYYETIDPYVKGWNDYFTPTPNETGAAARILGGFAQAGATLLASGGNPVPMIMGTGAEGSMSLGEQGVNPDVAALGGTLEATATALGFKVPFLGKSLPMRVATGAVGFPALNVAAVEAQRQLLLATGYSDLAAAYQPFNLTDRAADVFVGGLFGAVHHYGAGGRPITADARDAALAVANARHLNVDAAPGFPADIETTAIHQQAINEAMGQLLRDEPVVPPAALAEANFETKPPPMTEADVPPELKQLDLERQVDPLDALNFGLPTPPETLPIEHPLLVGQHANDSPERQALRQQLVDQRFVGKTPVPDGQRPVAFVMGGGGASGKGTVLGALKDQGAIDEQAVHLDPDEFKTGNKKSGTAGIPEYQQIIAAGDSRAARVTHEESGLLYKQALAKAIAGRFNLVLDRTLGNATKALIELKALSDAGYDVHLVGVSVEAEEALARAVKRALGPEKRYVPLDELLKAHKGFSAAINEYLPYVQTVRLFDNNVEKGQVPVLMAEKSGETLQVHDQTRYNAFARKANLNENANTIRELRASLSAAEPLGQTGSEYPGQHDTGTLGQSPEAPGSRTPGQRPVDTSGVPGTRLEQVFTVTGRQIDVRPKVVEASSLVTSDNPAFPQDLQPRDRANRTALDAQVNTIATKLQPELLGGSALASEGAPITGPGDVVESGNGRVMALRQVYANLPEKAAAYRAFLQAQGYDITGIKEPVLVRERTTPMTPEDRQAFATEANKPAIAAMSPVERAQGEKIEPAVESAASLAEQNPTLRVATGEINPDGTAETISAAEAMKRSVAEIAAAEENAKAFGAAVDCATQRGEA